MKVCAQANKHETKYPELPLDSLLFTDSYQTALRTHRFTHRQVLTEPASRSRATALDHSMPEQIGPSPGGALTFLFEIHIFLY
jgi:hypothetical protein